MADEDGQPDENGQEELFPQGSLTGGKTTLKTLVKTSTSSMSRTTTPA
jgi:hypothetical protein